MGRLISNTSMTVDGLCDVGEWFVAEGDHVAVHAHMQGRTASGNNYLNYYHFLYRLNGGRIAEVWEHVDTAYAFARMTGGT